MSQPVLSLPAILLLVAIGAVGLYLALPRGPESEPRSVRWAGAMLGTASLLFLALAAGNAPGRAASSLATLQGGFAYYGCALAVLLAGGTAVSARTVGGSITALAVLLAAAGGLTGLVGLAWAAWTGLGLSALAAAALVRTHWRRTKQPAEARGVLAERPVLLEISREPLLACVGGALLATGLLAACQAAVVHELPRTIDVEHNLRPPSQRYRAFPRLSVIERVTGGERSAAGDRTPAAGERDAHTERSLPADLAVLHHLLVTAGLLIGIGVVGLLTRRRIWAVAISVGVAVHAVILLLAAFAALPVRPAGPHVLLLAVLVVLAEGGLLAGAAFLLSGRWRNRTIRSLSSLETA